MYVRMPGRGFGPLGIRACGARLFRQSPAAGKVDHGMPFVWLRQDWLFCSLEPWRCLARRGLSQPRRAGDPEPEASRRSARRVGLPGRGPRTPVANPAAARRADPCLNCTGLCVYAVFLSQPRDLRVADLSRKDRAMQKYTASFLGRDCPGVVATVSRLLGETGCNIVEVTQTILSGEFAAIFVVQAPDGCAGDALRERLIAGLASAEVDLSVLVRPAIEGQWGRGLDCDPFVVTADGPDKPGLIAAMSRVFARHGVNIESLKAILGEGGADRALFVFEVMVPESVDLGRLRRELACEGQTRHLRVSVQHRDIFEAVHRVGSF